jgi:hypothetical protein
MIKLRTYKQGYTIGFTNWVIDGEYQKVPITKPEAKALLKLLRKHFLLEDLNYYRKQAGQPLVKRSEVTKNEPTKTNKK